MAECLRAESPRLPPTRAISPTISSRTSPQRGPPLQHAAGVDIHVVAQLAIGVGVGANLDDRRRLPSRPPTRARS